MKTLANIIEEVSGDSGIKPEVRAWIKTLATTIVREAMKECFLPNTCSNPSCPQIPRRSEVMCSCRIAAQNELEDRNKKFLGE